MTVRGQRFFRPAIAGVWRQSIGGGTPLDFGLRRRACAAPLLFRHLERRHTYCKP